jgi:phage terminase small subunit
MPRLRNAKHEAFAQAVAADTDLADAYEHAGFVLRRGNPNRLARHPKVAARIAELRSLVFPAELENLPKALTVAGQILGVAGNREMASRLADEFRRIARALEQQAGILESVPLPARPCPGSAQAEALADPRDRIVEHAA